MRKESEIKNAVYEAIDLINATSMEMNVPRGEIALELLEREGISPITKRAALIVRTQEIVKLNRKPKNP